MKMTVLTDAQVVRLHEASLWILDKVGVQVPHPEVRRRYPALAQAVLVMSSISPGYP